MGGKACDVLTDDERQAVRLAGQLYTLIADNICGHGPTRDDDLAELTSDVHRIQYRVMAQAAARLYRGEFRLMGDVVDGKPESDREGTSP